MIFMTMISVMGSFASQLSWSESHTLRNAERIASMCAGSTTCFENGMAPLSPCPCPAAWPSFPQGTLYGFQNGNESIHYIGGHVPGANLADRLAGSVLDPARFGVLDDGPGRREAAGVSLGQPEEAFAQRRPWPRTGLEYDRSGTAA
jgi:hypothetical protein